MDKHKVFVSFHHKDEVYKQKFVQMMTNYIDGMVDRSVSDGDIDPLNNTAYTAQQIREKYLAQSTVTVVLVGPETWKRKHVDWEISYSLRDTPISARSGLLGILLPNYQKLPTGTYNKYTTPPRLADNLPNYFARVYDWGAGPLLIQQYIHEAFVRRNAIFPDNSRILFANNRPDYQTAWQQ